MRTILLIATAGLCCLLRCPTPAAAEDLLGGLRFADGQPRADADFHGQSLVVIYFCGECPTAGRWLGINAKAVHDWIEANHVPARLVLATPDLQGPGLRSLDGDRGYHMDHALYAYDPRNRQNISLNNTLRMELQLPDGSVRPWMSVEDVEHTLTHEGAGAYHLPKDGLTDPKVLTLWWGVEREEPGALAALIAAAGRRDTGSVHDQLRLLLDHVHAACATAQAALVAAPPSLQAYEDLERLCARYAGLDTTAAQARLRELRKDKGVAQELRAREIYRGCQQELASDRSQEQEAGRATLAELAARMPETAYGRRAAAEAHAPPTP